MPEKLVIHGGAVTSADKLFDENLIHQSLFNIFEESFLLLKKSKDL